MINGQYPNTIYELSNDEDYDYDNLDTIDRDYMSDQPINNKERLLIDPDLLQEHLYNFKSNILNEKQISTLKNKNFTWSLQNKNLKNPKPKITTKKDTSLSIQEKEKKTTNFFNIDDIQSDQPLPPYLDGENQTSKSIEEKFIKSNNNKESHSSTYNVNPSYVDPVMKDLFLKSNKENPYSSSNQPSSSGSNQPHLYSSFTNQHPSYPGANQPQRPYRIFPAIPKWTCQFTSYNNCSITNDPQTGPLFQLQDHNYFPYQQSSGPNWYLMLNTSNIPANKIGGRLITPYIPYNRASKGCLTMNYITTGNEINKVYVHQQDNDNHCIWTSIPSTHESEEKPLENIIDLSINFYQSDPRFFIEVYLKHLTSRKSSFALAKLDLVYNQSCRNDQTNNCLPSYNRSPTNKKDQKPEEP